MFDRNALFDADAVTSTNKARVYTLLDHKKCFNSFVFSANTSSSGRTVFYVDSSK